MTPRAAASDEFQLGFGFTEAPDAFTPLILEADADAEADAEEEADALRAADKLYTKLTSMGLQHIRKIVLTRNRSILVSVKGFELRVHEGFVDAPTEMHVQIVRFVMARRKWERQAARDAIVSYQLPRYTKPARAPEKTHPEDEELADRLAEWHTRLNGERFAAQLKPVPIRVSRRMVRRLGHYAPGVDGGGPEIAISARHLRRDGFASALETLLHEMVHQWQHENGLELDHGAEFRKKCREVGAVPSAKRAVC
jgi:SprT-like family